MKILKKLKAILTSIETVDDYLAKKKELGEQQDIRITKLFRATMNGEQDWFIDLVKKNPECVSEIIQECINDESNK